VRSTDSVALWTDEVAHRLVKFCDVVCYSRIWKGQPVSGEHGGIQYRRKSVAADKWIRGGFALLDEKGLRNPRKPFYASPWCYRRFAAEVIADLRRNPVDVVHVQNFSQFVPMLRRALPHVKIVLHMHAEWLAKLDRDMIRPRMKAADAIIFCSDYFAQQTRDAWPEYAGRCHVVYNGVTLEEFEGVPRLPRADPESRRVLFVSRLSPDKGVHILVDAFAEVARQCPKAELKIVGPWSTLPKSFCIDHSSEDIIRNLAVFYNGRPFIEQLRERIVPEAAARVEITGQLTRDDLIRMYRSADVLILPSIYPEGFGIPILEAAACQVPAIVSRRGGMPEVVEGGKTGLIVEAGDAAALSSAIVTLLRDEPLRQSMGKTAWERVSRHFTWERIAESLMEEYEGVLQQEQAAVAVSGKK